MNEATTVPQEGAGKVESRLKPLILVVDDQAVNIQILHALLMEEFDVCMALNGADALAVCAASRPDLILLDVVMPNVDGYTVCSQLKADATTRHIPVIFVTGHLDREQEERGFAVGGADFITKPFHAGVVLGRVRALLGL